MIKNSEISIHHKIKSNCETINICTGFNAEALVKIATAARGLPCMPEVFITAVQRPVKHATMPK